MKLLLNSKKQKLRSNVRPQKKGESVGGGRSAKAFTLVEITLVMAMTMVLSAVLLLMLQSHISFMRILSSYEFLRDDAPQVNNMLTGIFGKANSYRIYASTGDAQSAAGTAVNTGGAAVRLLFRNPDGSWDQGIVGFDTDATSGETRLNYYSRNGAWSTTPTWTISQQPTVVTFTDDTGILLVTMTGPNGGTITYGGTGE